MALVLIAAATLTAGSSTVFAQDNTATASPITGSGTSGSVVTAKDFQMHKAKVLKHISDRLTMMQQIQSCVEAANDLQTMRACKPHRDKEHSDKDHGG